VAVPAAAVVAARAAAVKAVAATAPVDPGGMK